jgi:hypothetical protein
VLPAGSTQPGLIADLEQGHYFELAAATPDSSS